jgi:TP901 family phage tail tape measure protein
MIELFTLIPSWVIVVLFAATTIVGRAGASKIFFDVVGTFQSQRLIMDADAAFTTFQALGMDAFSGIEEAALLVHEQIQEIVDATVPLSREIAEARIEFDKFISEANRADLGGQIKDIGVQFSFTGDQALRAGAKMAQLSTILGEESVPAATEMSLAFGMIGEMEAEQAMQRMINLHQQTGFMLRGTTQAQFDNMSAQEKAHQIRIATIATLNELNAVEDHSAANMERITFVMNQFAAQAHLTGESIAEMAAMSAVLIEAGEEQGKAGRALRMIYARLGADTNGAASELEKLGVAVKKADGTMRPLNDILVDLDEATKNVSEGEKQRIAQTVGGNNHYVRMLKLMEGTERMTTLIGHANENASPVVEILNERFKDTAVRLNQAETALFNLRAEIGDEFLPVVAEATEAQVAFNAMYLGLLQTPILGDAVKSFISFQQIASKTVGPMMGMFLNVKQMNLALMTAVQVARALNGTQIAGFQQGQKKRLLEQELARLERNKLATGQQKIITEEMALAKSQEQFNLERQKLIIERFSGEEGRKEFQRQIQIVNSLKTQQALLSSELNTIKGKIQLKEIELGMSIREHANQKLKNGLLKNTANVERSIGRTIYNQTGLSQTQIKNKQIELDTIVKTLKAMGTEVLIMDAINKEGAEQVAIAARRRQLEQEILNINQRYNFSQMQTTANFLMQIQVGAMLASGAVAILGDKLGGDFLSKNEAAQVSMVMMSLTMLTMIPEMMMMTQSMSQLTATTGGQVVANNALASSNVAVANTANAAGTATRGMYLKAGVAGVVMLGLSIAIVKVANHFGLLEDAMGDLGFEDMMADAEEANALMLAGIEDQIAGVSGITNSYREATEAVQEFGGSREELFFGFKAGNVTGDLVKQIKQQGVENFIANTEIIMTNNFNGMTTKQAADEIVAQIESSAALSIGASVNYG